MQEIIIETLIDTLKLVPFLFLTFLLIEAIEHKFKNKTKKIINKSGKFGPFLGSLLGVVPQCGFSVSATNLYVTRVITLGTLISIYLSTSDEMLPIMLSSGTDISTIISILIIKVIIGIICGFLIDLIYRNKNKKLEIDGFCKNDHCDCNHGIFKSAIHHTLSIALFILIINFILNLSFDYFGKELISSILFKNNILAVFLTSIIGLIPNCGGSVILTELYLNSTINFGSLIAGLLCSSGVGMLVLFRVNKDLKENISILVILYLISVISGIIINLI